MVYERWRDADMLDVLVRGESIGNLLFDERFYIFTSKIRLA